MKKQIFKFGFHILTLRLEDKAVQGYSFDYLDSHVQDSLISEGKVLDAKASCDEGCCVYLSLKDFSLSPL